jgi:hypothetical protein
MRFHLPMFQRVQRCTRECCQQHDFALCQPYRLRWTRQVHLVWSQTDVTAALHFGVGKTLREASNHGT